MDLLIVLAGAAMGILTGLVPGLHVNTLAAVAFAVAPDAGPDGALFLVAVGTVHTIVTILPGTYLGVPDTDEGISMLPAHRLLLEGRGPDAVRASVQASLAALILSVVLARFYASLLDAGGALLERATPALLVAATVGLWLQEARIRVRRAVRASILTVASGALGLLAFRIPLDPWLDVPGSPLLPLLGGLFGAAGWSFAASHPPRIPRQSERATRSPRVPVLSGTLAAACTAVLPGLTSAVATSFAPGTRGHPLRMVAGLSAVNTAHTVFALMVWMSSGRIRTGLADAADRWSDAAWTANLPNASGVELLATVLLAGAVGGAATLALDRRFRDVADRVPSRPLALAGLFALSALVLVLSGWMGAALYLCAALVGRLPLHWGVRRVHLVGALIVPALMRSL